MNAFHAILADLGFLNPWMLAALPAIAVPIVIHLVHQRRFQTMPWAAMQFLLSAQAMSRGYARLRQWLILAARTLAIAGLIFAAARPLASGVLGLAGSGGVDTTFILVDRSPSMQVRSRGEATKLEAGLSRLADLLATVPSGQTLVVDSGTAQVTPIAAPENLSQLPIVGPATASADIPAMLEVVYQHLRNNPVGQTDVWILSDSRAFDWQPGGGRWEAIRQSFASLATPVRFRFLGDPAVPTQNRAIALTGAKRVGQELSLGFRITQVSAPEPSTSIPVGIEIDGVRTEVTIDLTGQTTTVDDYRIPLAGQSGGGWGRLSIPSDACDADNGSYFVFDQPAARNTIMVTDQDGDSVQAWRLAASIPRSSETTGQAAVIGPDQIGLAQWDSASLLLWNAALPAAESSAGKLVRQFVRRGGQAVFLAPRQPDGNQFAGVAWTDWTTVDPGQVTSWDGQTGWLARTESGTPVPVGDLKIKNLCGLSGQVKTLATVDASMPLVATAMMDDRSVSFIATTTDEADSSLASDGVVLYVLVRRAIAAGAESLAKTRRVVAGDDEPALGFVGPPAQWTRLAGDPSVVSTEFAIQAGAYQSGDVRLAVHRSDGEDDQDTIDGETMDSLFGELEFDRVGGEGESSSSLVQEIWRLFLLAMAAALLIEATLCLPKRSVSPTRAGAA